LTGLRLELELFTPLSRLEARPFPRKQPASLALVLPILGRSLVVVPGFCHFPFILLFFTLGSLHRGDIKVHPTMSSAEVIDALFERTIDIVQSLPKTGPIQTSYEEKLALYSLYKQATEGDVKAKRPGMLDMLGRAKWDAWAKRKGYASQEAKQLYVESLLKVSCYQDCMQISILPDC
jgi:acyl-CoA-binding protein